MPINDVLPAFWLAAGAQDKQDVVAAANFKQLLQTRVANVPFVIVPGGGHQGSVWRAALGPMLTWMTPQLAQQAAKADAAAAGGGRQGRRRAQGARRQTPPAAYSGRAQEAVAHHLSRIGRWKVWCAGSGAAEVKAAGEGRGVQGRSASEMTSRPFSSWPSVS